MQKCDLHHRFFILNMITNTYQFESEQEASTRKFRENSLWLNLKSFFYIGPLLIFLETADVY